jgi:hypothetical protein
MVGNDEDHNKSRRPGAEERRWSSTSLENFERNKVWMLVEPSHDVNVIRTKWVLKTNRGRMVRL